MRGASAAIDGGTTISVLPSPGRPDHALLSISRHRERGSHVSLSAEELHALTELLAPGSQVVRDLIGRIDALWDVLKLWGELPGIKPHLSEEQWLRLGQTLAAENAIRVLAGLERGEESLDG